MGVILYTILTGCLPYDDANLPLLFHKIREARFYMPLYLSTSARDLISRLMQPNPLNRISICEIKNHPWYNFRLPFYIQIMDNTKIETDKDIDQSIFQILKEVYNKTDPIES